MDKVLLDMWNFIDTYKQEYLYITISEITEGEKLKKLALICNNELSWHLHHNRIKPDQLTTETVINILCRDSKIFTNDLKRFEIARTLHIERNDERQSPRYKTWKRDAKLALSGFEYCAKCGSRENLELDHVQDRNGFRRRDLAYSVTNAQYLCFQCNSTKPVNADYRTAEIKEAQEMLMHGSEI